MRNTLWQYIIVVMLLLLFPVVLNWILLREAIVPVVGDSTTWLTFWPVYLSAMASFGMIYYTYRSLQQNKIGFVSLARRYEAPTVVLPPQM